MNMYKKQKMFLYQWCVLCLLLFFLGGCFRTPPPDIYMFDSAVDKAIGQTDAVELSGPRVLVGPINIPGYVNHTRLALREKNSVQLLFLENAQWAEPIQEGIERIVCESLSQTIRPLGGVAFPLRSTVLPTWQITVEVNRFDGALNGEAILSVTYAISPTHGQPLFVGSFTKSYKTGATLNTLVHAQSHLLKDFGTHLGDIVMILDNKQ